MRLRPVVSASLVLFAAGGASHRAALAAALPSPRHVVTVVSGETDAPVPGAVLSIGGRVMHSDARGEVVLDASLRGQMAITADGYLVRESDLTDGVDRLTLWPVHGAYSPDYVRALLYKPAYLTREEPPEANDTPLARIVARRVSIVPSAVLREDPPALRAHQEAVAAINLATEGRVTFVVESVPSAEVAFRTLLDPAATADALAYRDLRDGVVVGGKVVFASRAAARDPRFLAHELGHALGLQHSLVRTDMMYYACSDQSPFAFTPNEVLTVRLLLQRAPGNRFPDNDRSTDLAAEATARAARAGEAP
jgi:hypothetical protein